MQWYWHIDEKKNSLYCFGRFFFRRYGYLCLYSRYLLGNRKSICPYLTGAHIMGSGRLTKMYLIFTNESKGDIYFWCMSFFVYIRHMLYTTIHVKRGQIKSTKVFMRVVVVKNSTSFTHSKMDLCKLTVYMYVYMNEGKRVEGFFWRKRRCGCRRAIMCTQIKWLGIGQEPD